jgi:hypothetical protein
MTRPPLTSRSFSPLLGHVREAADGLVLGFFSSLLIEWAESQPEQLSVSVITPLIVAQECLV